MKKTLYFALITTLLLSACGSSYTGKYFDENMPDNYKEKYISVIDEQLELLKENPEDTAVLFELGVKYEALGNYKKAIDYYNQVLEIDPEHRVVLNNLSVVYEDMEDYEKAAYYIEELFMLDSLSYEVNKDAVRIFLLNDDLQAAENVLNHFNEHAESSQGKIAVIQNLVIQIDKYKSQQ